MKKRKAGDWTRRHILRSLPAMMAPFLVPRAFAAATKPAKLGPYSRFVDVAQSAGLTQVMHYGEPERNTYIVETNGAGCAFFDYDNDGWMDVFILGGRRLDS